MIFVRIRVRVRNFKVRIKDMVMFFRVRIY